MVNMEEFVDIFKLKKQGYTTSQIAELTGRDRKTITKYLQNGMKNFPRYTPRGERRPVILAPYMSIIDSLVRQGEEVGEQVSAVVVYERLHAKGYRGSVSTVRKHLQNKKRALAAIIKPVIVTQPGEQAQVDWGEKWLLTGEGKRVKVFLFCMTLGHSRMRFVRFYPRANRMNFLLGHQEAFVCFGGVPRNILYDQTKCAIDVPGFRKVTWNRQFSEFSLHYGFFPTFCRPYRPQTKGKVENLVKYVKRNMLPLYRFDGMAKLNEDAAAWCRKVNGLVHGTTNRIPTAVWEEEEKTAMNPRPDTPFHLYEIETRKVLPSSVVSFRSKYYSVPPQYIGKRVTVKTKPECPRFVICWNEEEIASHVITTAGGKYVISEEHKKQVWDVWRNDQPTFYRRQRMKRSKMDSDGMKQTRSPLYYEQFA